MGNDSILENRKNYKRNRVLDCIRSQEDVSRFTVKKMTSYSMTTVLSAVEELLEEGLIYEEADEGSRVGRKPIWLRVNPNGGYFIGVEFNAVAMYCVALDFLGEVIYHQKEPVDKKSDGEQSILAKIRKCVDSALAYIRGSYGGNARVYGIGLGVPGYVDSAKGIAISYAHIQNWKNVSLKRLIEEAYHLPCHMENNVNVMAFAFQQKFANMENQDYVFISVRTGIRMVSVVDGRISLSKSGFSGELGHVRIQTGGRMCTCGRFGCLNTEVADNAIVEKIQEGTRVGRYLDILRLAGGNAGDITIEHYVQAVKEGSADALFLMRLTASQLGFSIAMVVNILAPQRIVLSGAQMELGEIFLKEIYREVCQNVVEQNCQTLQMECSTLGSEIGAIGAASQVMNDEFSYEGIEV